MPIGKTNISEFTMGSHTYNRVYGTTLNPYDTTKSAGGSSGGAAAAVAAQACCRLPTAATSVVHCGIPANFNNVVALRPTVGLVPNSPRCRFPSSSSSPRGQSPARSTMWRSGCSAVAGPDARDPRTWPSDAESFTQPLARDFSGTRVAWCPDLGGLPLDARVRSVIAGQRRVFENLGCIVEDASPDLRDADDVFLVLRSWMSANTLGPLLETHRALMKPEAIWQIERGQRVTSGEVAYAMRRHAELLERMRRFPEQHPFMVCAVNQLPPFDASMTWPREVDGVAMEHYIAWMKSTYWISATLAPALSVPAGFTDDGLPVGIQIVGRSREDLPVPAAYAFEQATQVGRCRPPIAADCRVVIALGY